MWIVLVVLFLLAVLYALSLRTNTGRAERMRPFEERFVAHRGLHDNVRYPENSMAAFRRAADEGFAIELDVHLTADDQLVVFHDDTLKRICGDDRRICELSYGELLGLRLLGTEEGVPLFRDVLELVGGRVPLIVEIKYDGRYLETARLADEMLRGYGGLYCIESFHPLVVEWFRKNSPDTVRGLLTTDFFRDGGGIPWWQKLLLTSFVLCFKARPDFIAHDRRHKDLFSFRLCSALYRPVRVAWTVRSARELAEDRSVYSAFIFEGFDPRETMVRGDDK